MILKSNKQIRALYGMGDLATEVSVKVDNLNKTMEGSVIINELQQELEIGSTIPLKGELQAPIVLDFKNMESLDIFIYQLLSLKEKMEEANNELLEDEIIVFELPKEYEKPQDKGSEPETSQIKEEVIQEKEKVQKEEVQKEEGQAKKKEEKQACMEEQAQKEKKKLEESLKDGMDMLEGILGGFGIKIDKSQCPQIDEKKKDELTSQLLDMLQNGIAISIPKKE